MELWKGTLDSLVIKTLSGGSMHGYGVTRWIREQSGGPLDVEDAALYQSLHRMERRGWVESEWGRSENNRRAKYYNITPRGRKELAQQTGEIRRYVGALFQVLEAETA
jgi:PadR family transcriptional regulator PadR